MELRILETTADHIRAGYSCPCGCTPSVEFRRGADVVAEGCCCGNQFALGHDASASLTLRPGFQPQLQLLDAQWGERLEAAWLIGPSVHEAEVAHADAAPVAPNLDPVCGMTVDPEAARAKGLHSSYRGSDWFFCGRGCKLDFDEDPERYLDPRYVPSM